MKDRVEDAQATSKVPKLNIPLYEERDGKGVGQAAVDEMAAAREEAVNAKREQAEAAAAGGKSRLDVSLDDVIVDDFDDFVGLDDFEGYDEFAEDPDEAAAAAADAVDARQQKQYGGSEASFDAYSQIGGFGGNGELREGRHESPLDGQMGWKGKGKGKAIRRSMPMMKQRWNYDKRTQRAAPLSGGKNKGFGKQGGKGNGKHPS